MIDFEGLRDAVIRAINAADPIALLAMGAPEDDYDPEIRTILPRLPNAASATDVRTILHEEFAAWFDPDIAGGPERYDRAAEEIWAFIQDGL
jgi:hypothetical protein